MPSGHFQRISIDGIACAVPDKIKEYSDWYESFGQEAVDKFVKMTGVKRVCQSVEEQTASDLAFVAARNLLGKKGISPESIGALVFVSQGPDYRMPATAFVLQHRLGLSSECICFDVNLGCSGYVYGLTVLSSLMEMSDVRRGLLLVGDTSTKGISMEDRSAAMLFGDAGAATLLEKKSEGAVGLKYHLKTDGNRFKAIIKPAGGFRKLRAPKERTLWKVDGNVRSEYDTYMNGADVFLFTITDVPKMINEFFKNNAVSAQDYDCFAMHQANLYILRQLAKKTGIPAEKMPVSMDRFGNTSVTSIPLTLADRYGTSNGERIRSLLCAFGVGLSWGVVSAEIRASDILPILYTNEFYEDGGVSHD